MEYQRLLIDATKVPQVQLSVQNAMPAPIRIPALALPVTPELAPRPCCEPCRYPDGIIYDIIAFLACIALFVFACYFGRESMLWWNYAHQTVITNPEDESVSVGFAYLISCGVSVREFVYLMHYLYGRCV